MNDNVEIKVSEQLIMPVIQARINAAIVDAIGDKEALIAKMVELAMQQKVDYEGNKGKYSSDNKYDMVEMLTKKAIRDAVQEALVEWVAQNKQIVKDQLIKQLNKKPSMLVKAVFQGMVKSFSDTYRLTVDVSPKEEY